MNKESTPMLLRAHRHANQQKLVNNFALVCLNKMWPAWIPF